MVDREKGCRRNCLPWLRFDAKRERVSTNAIGHRQAIAAGAGPDAEAALSRALPVGQSPNPWRNGQARRCYGKAQLYRRG
jgi:hypothetical protein